MGDRYRSVQYYRDLIIELKNKQPPGWEAMIEYCEGQLADFEEEEIDGRYENE